MVRIKRQTIRDILEYIICLFTILDAADVWKRNTNGLVYRYGISQNILRYLVWMTILAYMLVNNRKILFNTNKLKIVLLVVVYNIVFIIINPANVVSFIKNYVFVLIFWIIFIGELKKKNDGVTRFLFKFSNIIVIFAAASLFLYVFGTILHLIPSTSVCITSFYKPYIKTIPCYFHLMYNGQTVSMLGMEFYRNTGIFTEAPGWAYYLSLAIMIELFIRNNLRWKTVGILSTVALTTFSTKAFLIIPIMFFLKYVKTSVNSYRKRVLKQCMIPLFIIAGYIFITQLLKDKATSNGESFYARLEDTLVALKVWKNNLWVGVGYGITSSFQRYLVYQKETGTGITAGLFKMLAQCGVYLGLEYFGGLLLLLNCERPRRYNRLCILIVIIFFIFVTGSWQETTFLFAVAYGLCSISMARERYKVVSLLRSNGI